MNPRLDRDDSTRGRLRILLVSPTPPPMAGIERFAQDILGSKLARHHRVDLFRTNIPSEWRPQAGTVKHTWNILKRDGFLGVFKTLTFVVSQFFQLFRLLRQEKYDVMHVLSTGGYGFFRNAVHIWLARRAGVRTMFHILGQIDLLYETSPGWLRPVISRSLDLADLHVLQSPGLADFVRPLTRRPAYSILNGVRTEALRAPDGYAHGSGPVVQVVSVGTLGHKKGTYDLLEAAARLRVRSAPVQFTLVGGGEVGHFRELAESKGLGSTVTFAGPVTDDHRNEILKGADIFVLPSHAEGQPIALLEAMAVGLPIVSSTVGSIPEVIKEKNGFLITPGDVDALVSCLERLVDDPDLREAQGRHNALEAQAKYSLHRVMTEIDGLYAVLLGA